MKTTYVIVSLSLLGAASVYAYEGDMNMIEFDAESVIQGTFSLDKSKTPGQKADNDTELNLKLNYARASQRFHWLQYAGNINYLKDTNSNGDVENYGFMVGLIYNFTDDLTMSPYASLYLGLNWNKEYGTNQGNSDDELLTSVLAIGKRVSLERWGLKHLTYSPEIALRNQNSTTGGDLEYAQSLEFRFLQFAVFF